MGVEWNSVTRQRVDHQIALPTLHLDNLFNHNKINETRKVPRQKMLDLGSFENERRSGLDVGDEIPYTDGYTVDTIVVEKDTLMIMRTC